ncbi:MAG: damage-inducible protein CinA [Gammaproteobacteria bacterium 28-57-27]|nr:MAG: damage-inducible protein CinA [Gammaproteobacteria bacterium 28-57-27]
MRYDDAIGLMACELGETMAARGLMLAVAESCTGGWLAKAVTDIAGSSAWFDRGFVTYSNQAKQDMLGVPEALLRSHGAVSEASVLAMVEGALEHSLADISVAISGIAGPGGATPDKPVGTVWLAWARRGEQAKARRFVFDGDRESVRAQAVVAGIDGVLLLLPAI